MITIQEMTDFLVAHATPDTTPEELHAKFDQVFVAELEHRRFEAGRRASLIIAQRAEALSAQADALSRLSPAKDAD